MLTTTAEIMAELKALGSESYKRLMMKNHGVPEPCYGVKIGDLQKIRKRIETNHELALELFDTGNYDAMYLAGLIADDSRMTRRDLVKWANNARAGAIAGYTVARVAAGSSHGRELSLKWIDSSKPLIALTGWATLASLVALKDDADLDLAELERLLQRVKSEIHAAPDLVRYQMNAFLISVGSYVRPLTEIAFRIAQAIGPVTADLGENNCQVPFAPDYINKVRQRGTFGKKRKSLKC
jgi:3-methyladenine DNA glycosylase AlkD